MRLHEVFSQIGNGQFIPKKNRFTFSRFAFICFSVTVFQLLFFELSFSQVQNGWDVNTYRTLSYTIFKDMAHDSTSFTERDTITLNATIDSGQIQFTLESTFYDTTEFYDYHSFTEDGLIFIDPSDSNPPPMEAEFLFHLFASPPFDTNTVFWNVESPANVDSSDSKIVLLRETDFESIADSISNGDTLLIIRVRSYLKLIDNPAIDEFLFLDSLRPPEIQNIIDNLGQRNLFLTGTVVWNRNVRETESGFFTYVPIPHYGGDSTSIANSWNRQVITAFKGGQP